MRVLVSKFPNGNNPEASVSGLEDIVVEMLGGKGIAVLEYIFGMLCGKGIAVMV